MVPFSIRSTARQGSAWIDGTCIASDESEGPSKTEPFHSRKPLRLPRRLCRRRYSSRSRMTRKSRRRSMPTTGRNRQSLPLNLGRVLRSRRLKKPGQAINPKPGRRCRVLGLVRSVAAAMPKPACSAFKVREISSFTYSIGRQAWKAHHWRRRKCNSSKVCSRSTACINFTFSFSTPAYKRSTSQAVGHRIAFATDRNKRLAANLVGGVTADGGTTDARCASH